ncbi:hypothetical protein F7725_017968 [Dissostichus mawsoni]|uniref:Uncharacterized protein n=1 Tax=Dissostichus mawsoni TaxID=36200 RepID=A0A7J5XQN5_DISMA|nr:hypothetical protein F7725_017968 [Dissostichus mawsoni]
MTGGGGRRKCRRLIRTSSSVLVQSRLSQEAPQQESLFLQWVDNLCESGRIQRKGFVPGPWEGGSLGWMSLGDEGGGVGAGRSVEGESGLSCRTPKLPPSASIFVSRMPPASPVGAEVSTLVLVWRRKVPPSVPFPLSLPVSESWTKVSPFRTQVRSVSPRTSKLPVLTSKLSTLDAVGPTITPTITPSAIVAAVTNGGGELSADLPPPALPPPSPLPLSCSRPPLSVPSPSGIPGKVLPVGVGLRMGEERGVAGGRRVVDGGKLLLLHRRLVLWVVVSRVTGVAPAPLATGRGATLPAGGGVGVRMGGGLGLRQQRGRSGLSLVQEFVRLFYFVSFYLYLSGKVLSPELQGLQGRWRRERRGGKEWGMLGLLWEKSPPGMAVLVPHCEPALEFILPPSTPDSSPLASRSALLSSPDTFPPSLPFSRSLSPCFGESGPSESESRLPRGEAERLGDEERLSWSISRPLLRLLLLLARLPTTELLLPWDWPSSLSLSRDWLATEVGGGTVEGAELSIVCVDVGGFGGLNCFLLLTGWAVCVTASKTCKQA